MLRHITKAIGIGFASGKLQSRASKERFKLNVLKDIWGTVVEVWRDVRHVNQPLSERAKLHILFEFLPRLYPHKHKIASVLTCRGVLSLFALVSPLVMKFLIDMALPNKDLGLMWLLLGGSVAIWCVQSLVSLVRIYLEEAVQMAVRFQLRRDFFIHIQKLSLAFFESRSTGDHMYRADSDISNVVGLITRRLPDVAEAVFHLTVLIGVTMYMSWHLTLVTLTIVPLQWISLVFFSRRIRIYNIKTREQKSQINVDLQEAISSIRLIKAFGKEASQTKKYSRSMLKQMKTYLKSVMFSHTYFTLRNGVGVVWSAGLTLYCGYQVMSGLLTVGEMMALILYVSKLQGPIGTLVSSYADVQQDLVAAERMLETLELKPDVVDKDLAIEAPLFQSQIVFQNVSFNYGTKLVLKDTSFALAAGSRVALVGPNGAGKTTIAFLILRLYDPSAGRILFDGLDLRDLRIESVRSQIGIMLQESLLLPGSIKDNLRFARQDATDDEIVEACVQANAHEFIERLPQGYDTNIVEKGGNLSGGQQQRLALARALIRQPAILILDEPSSYQDPESERAISETIWNDGKRTTLIIAHNLNTIRKADQILVLDEGRIVESGFHEQLISKGGLYTRLYGQDYDSGLKTEEFTGGTNDGGHQHPHITSAARSY